MTFDECIEKYYIDYNYNCSETLIHAANEYYGLNLDEESMKMMSGFGGGMFVGGNLRGPSLVRWRLYLKR